MQKRAMDSAYDKVLRVLSIMEYAKPVALITISQKTGIKLADIIEISKTLEQERIIERGTDNGNTFYTLAISDYHAKIEALFNPPQEESQTTKVPVDSREAIRRRRSMRNIAAAENNDSASASASHSDSIPGTMRAAEPISAVDLLRMKRSSAANPRVYDSGLGSSTRLPRIPGSSQSNPVIDRRSSGSLKSVFVSRPISRSMSSSRSTYTATPPAGFDPTALERSDTNFKTQTNYAPASMQSLIPSNAIAQVSNEISAAELYEKLQITEDTPLLTVLGSRPSFEVWSSCSAIVNAGGGILILGMRQYGQGADASFFIKSLARPEETMSNIFKAFNDRDIISDCPKDMSFMSIVEFGRKKVLVLTLKPELFSQAPLYLTRDSFGMRTNQGCYIYRNGKPERCTPEETQLLWEKIRLGNEVPDWQQNGEILPVQMTRNVKVNLPPIIDDAVRPLSRKVSTYGQPLPQDDYRLSHLGTRTFGAPVSTPEQPAPRISETMNYATGNTELQAQKAASERAFKALVQDGSPSIPQKQPKSERPSEPNADTLQLLLFAEDIRLSKQKQAVDEIPSPASKSVSAAPKKRSASHDAQPEASQAQTSPAPSPDTASLPPSFAESDQKLLEDIASPAIEHQRLPTARLCEIAATLLTNARLTPQELANLLNRKLPMIRTKVLPAFSQNPKFKLTGNTYYIEK